MNKFNQVTILGSGTSTGVPVIGCDCQVCQSNDPYNKRLRASIFLHTAQNKKILVDTATDMRTQLLNHQIHDLDATILTHAHADHIGGLDDLRAFCFKYNKKFPLFCLPNTLDDLVTRFPYIFNQKRPALGGGIPDLEVHTLKLGPEKILNEDFMIFEQIHGYTTTIGFVHGKFAYFIDCFEIKDETIEFLNKQKLELLIIDCVRREPHQTHLNLEKALQYIDRIKPLKAGLSHLSHDFDHQELKNELVQKNFPHVFPVFDGQVFTYSS